MNGRDSLLDHVEPGSRVLVVAAAGMRNAGDEAMLAGLLARLAGRFEITVVSADPDATRQLHGIPAVGPGSALAGLRRSDALVIGGGSLFSSSMGRRGRLIPLFGLAALAAGKPVSLAGMSFDRTTPGTIRPLVKLLARRACEVRVRDRPSASRLAAWGVAATIEPDLSSWLPPAPTDRSRRILVDAGIHFDRPIVGMCLTSANPGLGPLLLDAIPQVVAALPEVQFCLLPMSEHPDVRREDDGWLAREIAAAAGGSLPILPAAVDPAELPGLFSLFDAAVCMRYHSLLFADRAGVPLVAIPYAAKCAAWVAEHSARAVPLDAGAIVAALIAALETRAARAAPLAPAAMR